MITAALKNQRPLQAGQRPPGQAPNGATNQTASLLALLLTLACVHTTAAAAPAEHFEREIRRYQEAASSARNVLGELMIQLDQVPPFDTVDGPLITRHLETVAQIWTEAAAALEQGDEPAATALAKRARDLKGERDRWKERLHWRARQAQQGEYLPATAEIHSLLAKDRKPEDLVEMESFLEAKKRRSEAYGRLAEATTPTADPRTIFQLQDEVFTADIEVHVADLKYAWSREDWAFKTWVATDPQITSPELTSARDQVQEWRRQREELYRQSRLREQALEQWDRQKDALLVERERAYRAAKAARQTLEGNR